MSLQNLNPSFVLSKKKALQDYEREYLQSFIIEHYQHKSDKKLIANSRDNVLNILNKSKFNQYHIVIDEKAYKISVADMKRKTVDYKKVLKAIKEEHNLSQASIDELEKAHTSVTEYKQINIGE